MTPEDLNKRLAEIEAALQQAQANFNVMLGGKNEVLYWINKLNENKE